MDGSVCNLLKENYQGGFLEKIRFQNMIIDNYYLKLSKQIMERKQTGTGDNFLIFSERSLLTNASIFIKKENELGNFPLIDFEILQWKSVQFHELLLDQYNMSDFYVYLQTDPAFCFARMLKRGRSEEMNLVKDMISDLHTRYELLYDHLSKTKVGKVLILNVDSFVNEDNLVNKDKLVEKMCEFMKII